MPRLWPEASEPNGLHDWRVLDRRPACGTPEGVETEEQRKLLVDLGCTQMQGFLFSPARPAAEIRALLRGGARRGCQLMQVAVAAFLRL